MSVMSFRRQDRRLRHRIRRTKSTFVVGCVLVLCGLLMSGQVVEMPVLSAFGSASDVNRVEEQVPPPAVAPPPGLGEQLAALPVVPNGAPLMLTYHDVKPQATNQYVVTPTLLATQMRLLAEAGYRSIRSADLIGWLDGKPLPPKSVFISFDDGNTGVWKYADPILAAYGFTGNVFVISSRAGQGSFYMTWPELRKLGATGRWDIQAHTRDGHRYVPRSAAPGEANKGAFLTTRAWLPAANRVETPAEYQRRVNDDLTGNIADLQARGFPRPTLFAFPFSEAASSDTRATAFVRGVTSRLFAGALLDDSTVAANSLTTKARRQPYRLNVLGTDSLATFVDKVRRSTVLPLKVTRPLADPRGWVAIGGNPQAPKGVVRGRATVSVPARGWQEIAYAPSRTGFWRDYNATVTVSGLSRASQAAGGLALRVGTPGELSVSTSATWLSVKLVGARTSLFEGQVPPAATHRLTLRVQGRTATAIVDGVARGRFTVPAGHGGPGLFASGGPTAARVGFTGLTVGPLTAR
jgi:poly-beta-1,6-N-acetyl-D-glucosamine N-deacetylase